MTDEMIAALAKKGGVVQINFSCDFLNADVLKAEAAAGTGTKPRATLADVVSHIDHVVAIGGIGAVGLGSDFDGISCAPVGLDGVDKWPNLTRALLEEGYTAAEIRKIYGENTLRLMAEVERVARSIR
jgi:membrane dipeptidase